MTIHPDFWLLDINYLWVARFYIKQNRYAEAVRVIFPLFYTITHWKFCKKVRLAEQGRITELIKYAKLTHNIRNPVASSLL